MALDMLRPVYGDTTQLNLTSSCVGEVSIATLTQLDSVNNCHRSVLNVMRVRVSIATQLNSTRRQVESSCIGEVRSVYSDPPTQLHSTSSCIAINGPLSVTHIMPILVLLSALGVGMQHRIIRNHYV